MNGLASLLFCLGLLLDGSLGDGSVANPPTPDASTPDPIRAERLPESTGSQELEGVQYLVADDQGDLYVLYKSTLSVHPITPSGTLGDPRPLETAEELGEPPRLLRDVAVSPNGDDWLLLTLSDQARWFPRGREVPLPALGSPGLSVALPGGVPTVAVLPFPGGRSFSFTAPEDEPAVVFEWDRSAWRPMFREPFEPPLVEDARRAPDAEFLTRLRHEHEVHLVADGSGGLWLSHKSAYRLRHVTTAGKVRTSIVVGDGQVAFTERPEEQWDSIREALEEAGMPFDRDTISRVVVVPVVLGLTATPTGALYLVVRGEDGQLFLDRWDATRLVLERLALEGPEGNRFQLAAGRDGLYLASVQASDGRWRIPWERLDEARWTPVPDVTLDGVPLEPLD